MTLLLQEGHVEAEHLLYLGELVDILIEHFLGHLALVLIRDVGFQLGDLLVETLERVHV